MYKIEEAAVKIWRQQIIISAWCSAERANQHGNKASKVINSQEREKTHSRKPKSKNVRGSGGQEGQIKDQNRQLSS